MVSVVIPFYNEEGRIKINLDFFIGSLTTIIKEPLELVLVNDGSSDDTEKLLNDLKTKISHIPVEVISYSPNQGKGFAVKKGVLHTKGGKIIVMDADFSVDINEIPNFLDKLNTHDIVIGTKKHLLTQTIKQQKRPRRILGKGFTLLTNFILGLNYTDITCGFKGFRAKPAKDIFARQQLNRWAYDAETLFLAKQRNYKINEVPVRWRHVEGSKVSPMLDTFRSLKDIITILLYHYFGFYDQQTKEV